MILQKTMEAFKDQPILFLGPNFYDEVACFLIESIKHAKCVFEIASVKLLVDYYNK